MEYENSAGVPATGVQWTPPTTRTDGTPYGTDDHAGYELGAVNEVGEITPHVSIPAAYNITSWPLDQLNINTVGRHEIALRTVPIDGSPSAWSNTVVFTAKVAAPNAPTGLTVS